jgi:hypothetical protein
MNNQSTEERLAVKTREQRFLTILQTEFQYAPREAQEVLAVAQEVLVPSVAAVQPGQMRAVLAAAHAPSGRPLRAAQLVEVVWTVDAGREDLDVLTVHGATALRRVRLMRLAEEAVEQGGLATEEDLARALQVSVRTVRRDIAALHAAAYLVPTRGKIQGVGRGQSHKVIIVGLYLDGYSYQDIQHRSHHSLSAIQRYITWFGRVALLHAQDLAARDIGFLLGLSTYLVEQYLALLATCTHDPRARTLTELLQRLHAAEKGGRQL